MPDLWQSPVRLLCALASAAGGTWEAKSLPSSGGFLENSSAGQQEQPHTCLEPKKTGGSSAIGTWPLGTQPPPAFLCRAVCPPSPTTPSPPEYVWCSSIKNPRLIPTEDYCSAVPTRSPPPLGNSVTISRPTLAASDRGRGLLPPVFPSRYLVGDMTHNRHICVKHGCTRNLQAHTLRPTCSTNFHLFPCPHHWS